MSGGIPRPSYQKLTRLVNIKNVSTVRLKHHRVNLKDLSLNQTVEELFESIARVLVIKRGIILIAPRLAAFASLDSTRTTTQIGEREPFITVCVKERNKQVKSISFSIANLGRCVTNQTRGTNRRAIKCIESLVRKLNARGKYARLGGVVLVGVSLSRETESLVVILSVRHC